MVGPGIENIEEIEEDDDYIEPGVYDYYEDDYTHPSPDWPEGDLDDIDEWQDDEF